MTLKIKAFIAETCDIPTFKRSRAWSLMWCTLCDQAVLQGLLFTGQKAHVLWCMGSGVQDCLCLSLARCP